MTLKPVDPRPSWWLNAPREGWTQRCWQELPQMRIHETVYVHRKRGRRPAETSSAEQEQ